MNEQVTFDGTRLTFTEQGLADALASALLAIEGGTEEEATERGHELANTIFLAATLEARGLL